MGQYYKPTFLNKTTDVTANDYNPIMFQLSPHTFDKGAKLMEHSYVGNPLVQAVENLLAKDNEGTPFVWAGDYADPYQGFTSNLYEMGDKEEEAKGLAELITTSFKGILGMKCYKVDNPKAYKYIINHTKKLYVSVPQKIGAIHPLPLLTAESNGLGGGDYYSKVGEKFVGAWKYDKISMGDEVPDGYEELNVTFRE